MSVAVAVHPPLDRRTVTRPREANATAVCLYVSRGGSPSAPATIHARISRWAALTAFCTRS